MSSLSRPFNGIHGSKNDAVGTPTAFYDYLNGIHHFDFDPCPLERPEWDGLEREWGQCNFVNPPYSEIRKWLKKGVEEMKKGRKSVFLITAKTNTKYWFDFVYPHAHFQFIEGGLIFQGYEKKFPFALALVVFDPARPLPIHSFREYEPRKRIASFF